ncbi:MAG TPA: RNA methyltransferase [Leptolinea sp.]
MISSKKNPLIQTIRTLLQDRKSREETGLFIIEGVRLVEDAIANHAHIAEVYFSPSLSDRGRHLIDVFQQTETPTEEVDEKLFLELMDTSTSQGIAAICRIPEIQLPSKMDFVIIADQLRDPGNLGTLLRTAAAAGAQAVLTTPGSVDLFAPKVVRSAMGAHFHLNCFELGWDQINNDFLRDARIPLNSYVAATDGNIKFWDCNFTLPTLLVIGGEAEGASDKAFEFARQRISIPMPGNFESLNAAVAAGILIFEVVRQRLK